MNNFLLIDATGG